MQNNSLGLLSLQAHKQYLSLLVDAIQGNSDEFRRVRILYYMYQDTFLVSQVSLLWLCTSYM